MHRFAMIDGNDIIDQALEDAWADLEEEIQRIDMPPTTENLAMRPKPRGAIQMKERKMIEARAGICVGCGAPGILVDTTAGEIVEDGKVVAFYAEDDAMMVSDDGAVRCDDCEDERRRLRRERQSTR